MYTVVLLEDFLVFKNILDLYGGGGGGGVSEIVFLSADLILGETDEDA